LYFIDSFDYNQFSPATSQSQDRPARSTKGSQTQARLIDKVIRPQFIKFRDLENFVIKEITDKIKKNPELIYRFEDKGKMAPMKTLYRKNSIKHSGSFELIKTPKEIYNSISYKNIRFKKDVLKIVCYRPFTVIRNWIVKNEDLKTISKNTIKLLSINKFKEASIKKLLPKGTLSAKSIEVLKDKLEKNVFGDSRVMSKEYISLHLGQIKNLFVNNRILNDSLKEAISKIYAKNEISDDFCESVINSFTKKKNYKTVPIEVENLEKELLKRYVISFKSNTTVEAKKKLVIEAGKKKAKITVVFFLLINLYNYELRLQVVVVSNL